VITVADLSDHDGPTRVITLPIAVVAIVRSDRSRSPVVCRGAAGRARHGNYRVLMNLGDERLAATADQDLPPLDEKLLLACFEQTARPQAAAQARSDDSSQPLSRACFLPPLYGRTPPPSSNSSKTHRRHLEHPVQRHQRRAQPPFSSNGYAPVGRVAGHPPEWPNRYVSRRWRVDPLETIKTDAIPRCRAGVPDGARAIAIGLA
jgi:hypothetical protein